MIEIKEGRRLSGQLREFLSKHTGEIDLKDIASKHGLSWYTLRSLKSIERPNPVTENTKGAVLDLLKRAIQNRNGYLTDIDKRIEVKEREINLLKADRKRSLELWKQNVLAS